MTPEEIKKEALNQLQNLQAGILLNSIEVKELSIENEFADIPSELQLGEEKGYTGFQIMNIKYSNKELKQ